MVSAASENRELCPAPPWRRTSSQAGDCRSRHSSSGENPTGCDLAGVVRGGGKGHRDPIRSGHDVPGVSPAEAAAKKKSLHASQRDTPRVKRKRRQFQKEVAQLDVKRFKFLDESSVNMSLTRL